MSHATSTGRGQSNVIATVLILSITVAATTVIMFTGSAALNLAQQDVNLGQAENAFTQLDSKASLVALGQTSTQEHELNLAGQGGSVQLVEEGWFRVQVINTTDGSVDTTVVNRSLGTIRYVGDETTIAYQSGGVWRGRGNGSVMVSKPEFHYRESTLTVHVLDVDGSVSDDTVLISSGGDQIQRYPNESADLSNPVEDKKVQVTIHSEYYHGWGSFFEDRTEGGVSYDHGSDEVTLTLLHPTSNEQITNAMVIGGGGGTLDIQSGQNSVVNSYNSSAVSDTLGPPGGPGPPGSNSPSLDGSANLTTTKDVIFGGNAEVTGNLTTSGSVSFSGSTSFTRVGENLQYGSGNVSDADCSGYVDGWCANNASVETRDPMDAEVQDTIRDLNDSNDNADESCFSESGAVEFGAAGCGSSVTLTAGDYYTTSALSVSGDKLILDTTDGDVRIAVDDDKAVSIDTNANVTVIGDGEVKLYATESYTVDGGDTLVWNPGFDAPQLWLYCVADCQVNLQGSSTFVGVVYAPAGSDVDNAQVIVRGGQTEVYGAVVGGGDSKLEDNADIHFDRAVSTQRPFEQAPLSSVTHLHVSVTQLNVSAG